jgi:hypothetical protein
MPHGKNVTPTPSQDVTKRVLDVVEFGSKSALGIGSVWALLEKVIKPFYEWRKKHMANVIREILKDELATINHVAQDRKDFVEVVTRVFDRQGILFDDIDQFIEVSNDNRERVDEVNELLDAIGLSAERRMDPDRRKRVDTLLANLEERRVARARMAIALNKELPEGGIGDLIA